jgi:nucleotide-binding universal stress UspA family protein
MYNKIVIPLALDQGHGLRAMALARRLKTENGKIIAVHVIDKIPGFAKYYMTSENQQKIKQSARDSIDERIGSEKDAETVVLTGQPGRTITDYANKMGADCIIVGAHKRGLKDFFLGSTASRIVRYAKCSVHVLREDSHPES